jgi:hypothetical protein
MDVQQPPVDQQVNEPELATEQLRAFSWADERRQHRLLLSDCLEVVTQCASDLAGEGAVAFIGAAQKLDAHRVGDDRGHDRRRDGGGG